MVLRIFVSESHILAVFYYKMLYWTVDLCVCACVNMHMQIMEQDHMILPC